MFINKKCSHLTRKHVVLREKPTVVEEKKVTKKIAKTEKVEPKEENKIVKQ